MREKTHQKAKDLAYIMHEGQKRKEGIPYITHPEGVVEILEEYGVKDESTLAVGWLHDVLEDTDISYEYLEKEFGEEISDKVYLLTRNIDRKEYKTRIEQADYQTQMVKLADTLHNVYDPHSLNYLSDKGVRRKVEDCREFYIPLAERICPEIASRLEDSIETFIKTYGRYKKR